MKKPKQAIARYSELSPVALRQIGEVFQAKFDELLESLSGARAGVLGSYTEMIEIPDSELKGVGECRVCSKAREKSGKWDMGARQRSGRPPSDWCWCGEAPDFSPGDSWSEMRYVRRKGGE